MQPGVWTTTVQINLKSEHKLLGKDRDSTILMAVEPWVGNGTENRAEAVVHNNISTNAVLANFTVDANHLSTFGLGSQEITIDSMKVINAKCDGIAVAGHNMIIQDSLIENNGKDCPHPEFGDDCPVELRYDGVCYLPGSGIYVTNPDDPAAIAAELAPVISGNTIRYNGGPGLDVDRVWGGVFDNNVVYKNRAWAGVSLYSASHWMIEDNTIYHPAPNNILHPNHEMCHGGPQGEHSAGLYLCQDTDLDTEHNTIRNNRIAGYYGILSIGDDEGPNSWIPRNNVFQGNNLDWSTVGCADDFEPSPGVDGLNAWENNNCAGPPDSLPLYFDVLCPSAVRRSTVQEWSIGETSVSVVDSYIDLFDAERTGGGEFVAGDDITPGVVIAINFSEAGSTWDEFPVTPVVHHQSYGLFEATGPFTAPYSGACLTIAP